VLSFKLKKKKEIVLGGKIVLGFKFYVLGYDKKKIIVISD